jgi:DNA repair protein RadD
MADLFSPSPPQNNDRYYQAEACRAFWDYYQNGGTENGLISMATGTGKSRVQARICQQMVCGYPNTGIVCAVSVMDLVEQNYKEMVDLHPQANTSIYSAGVGQKDLSGQIIFAGIQSIYKQAFKIPRRIDLLIVDECQDLSENDGTMYRKLIADLKLSNPELVVLGLSATIFRMSQGLLTDGKNALFGKLLYEYPMLQGITDGYLSPLVSKSMSQNFDLSEVSTRNGDYIASQLEKAVDKDAINQAIVDEIITYGDDRKCWLIFCVGVDHAMHLRDVVRSRGYSCEAIYGSMPKDERRRILKAYNDGDIRCVTNVNVMTKGTNIPRIDLIASARPSRSAGLVVQAAGRGTRLFKGKDSCLILDFAKWLELHGPIDLIKAKKKGEKGEGVAPTKACPECKTIVFAGVAVCPECDFVFPPPEVKIQKEASEAAVLSTQLKTETYPVTGVSYYRHKKAGAQDSMRVEYQSGILDTFSSWKCFSHTGRAREVSCFWWRKWGEGLPPKSTDEALLRVKELRMPSSIRVKRIGKNLVATADSFMAIFGYKRIAIVDKNVIYPIGFEKGKQDETNVTVR